MSRVIHTGSDIVLRSREEIEQRLLQKVEASTKSLIGTELELFVTGANGEPATYNQIAQILTGLAESFPETERFEEEGRIVGLSIPGYGNVSLEPGGQVELSSKPCADLIELERVNRIMRDTLDKVAGEYGLRVKGEGHNPAFMTAEDMPRSRFAAYYRYCGHEIGRAAEGLIKTMKSVASLQVNLNAMGRDFHEVYRALLLTDVAVAFNNVSRRQERLDMTYAPFFPEQTEPMFAALKAENNFDLLRQVTARLMTIRVPFIPDQSPEGFQSTIDVFGKPPTVGQLLEKGLLTEEILDNSLSLQLTLPNLRGRGVLENRAHDSVDSTEKLMQVARLYRNAAYNEAARKDLLKRFRDIDPDLLRVAFNMRSRLPREKLMRLDIGGGLTVADLAATVAARPQPYRQPQAHRKP